MEVIAVEVNGGRSQCKWKLAKSWRINSTNFSTFIFITQIYIFGVYSYNNVVNNFQTWLKCNRSKVPDVILPRSQHRHLAIRRDWRLCDAIYLLQNLMELLLAQIGPIFKRRTYIITAKLTLDKTIVIII